VLNRQPHDIPALIAARLLKPLGNPTQNSTKWFCAAGHFGNGQRPRLAGQDDFGHKRSLAETEHPEKSCSHELIIGGIARI
jgi:hypothetical protein